jgi:hypothetical protein
MPFSVYNIILLPTFCNGPCSAAYVQAPDHEDQLVAAVG